MKNHSFGTAPKAAPQIVLTAVGVAVALTMVGALVGCNPTPIVVQKKLAVVSTTPAEIETPPVAGTTVDNGDGTFSLSFPLPKDGDTDNSRSLVNLGALESGAVDYYQMILVDDSEPDKIWASSSADKVNSPNGILTVVVQADTTYHILFLHGKKAVGADPILLGSGYLRYKVGTVGTSVIIRMVPMLIDATITGSSNTPWAGIGKIAWVKDENFDVTVNLRSRIAGQDVAASLPHGNPLWPLLLAQERKTNLWKDKGFWVSDAPLYVSTKTASDALASGESGKWEGPYWYYDGEKDWSAGGASISGIPSELTILPSSPATASVSVYYSEGSVPSTAQATQSGKIDANAVSGKTTGVLKFAGFTSLKGSSDTTDYGKFSFNQDMTYVPFGITDWSTASSGGTDVPHWKIGGGDDLYLAYRLYGRAIGLDSTDVGAAGSGAEGAPAGVSWATAANDLQYLANLSGAAYAQDSATLKEVWAEAGSVFYENAAGSGIVVSMIHTAAKPMNGIALYGGFKPKVGDADDKDNRLAPLGARPSTRSTWFNTYAAPLSGNSIPPLLATNKYGTVVDSTRKTTLSAEDSDMVVSVGAAAHIVIDGFTLTNGRNTGLWIENAPNTTLFTNLEVSGNKVIGSGGGGIRVDSGAPVLDKLTITGNTSTGEWGGGMHITGTCTSLITNIFVSGNTATSDSGGGIAIAGANPRIENVVVTGNQSRINGGGIYSHGSPVIVNALISGNTTIDGPGGGAQGKGGALYMTYGPMTLVNALISGNKTEVVYAADPNVHFYGGGGVKVCDGQLTLVNCTVSGNYVSYNKASGDTSLLPGGGIMVVRTNSGTSTVRVYNSLVLGNTGNGVGSDVALNNGALFYAYNSLVGGWTKAQMDATATGGNNLDGSAYATTVPGLLTNLKSFFTAFNALPTMANTGEAVVADWTSVPLWNFHLRSGATGAINGGSNTYLADTYTHVTGGLQQDLDGAARIKGSAPDLGAYESAYLTVSGGGGFGY